MKGLVLGIAILTLVPMGAMGASVANISDATELVSALLQGDPGDVMTLDSDVQLVATVGIAVPTGVILDLNGFTLRSNGSVNYRMFSQDGDTATSQGLVGGTGAIVRNGTLDAGGWDGWTNQVRDGASLRFEDLLVKCRTIAWANAQVEFVNCRIVSEVNTQQVPNWRFTEGIATFGANSTISLENCFIYLEHQNGRQGQVGIVHNFGNGCTITADHCTFVKGPQPAGSFTRSPNDDCMGMFRSSNAAGANFTSLVTNSVFVGSASSAFWQEGTGSVTSQYNVNAGSPKSSSIMFNQAAFMQQFAQPLAPNFYHFNKNDVGVLDKTGDFEELNPFVSVKTATANENYALVAQSKAATGDSTGGPVGCDLFGAPQDLVVNAYNLNFEATRVLTLSPVDAVFDGWLWQRDTLEQFFQAVPGRSGYGLEMEAEATNPYIGGGATFISQSVRQVVQVKEDYEYYVSAWTRRNASGGLGGFTWANNGQYGHNILALSLGDNDDWSTADVIIQIDSAENVWRRETAAITIPAGVNQLTIHLVHETNGTYNVSTWDDVSISAFPALQPASAKGFNLYR